MGQCPSRRRLPTETQGRADKAQASMEAGAQVWPALHLGSQSCLQGQGGSLLPVPFRRVLSVKGAKEAVGPVQLLVSSTAAEAAEKGRCYTLNTDTGIEVIPGIPATSRFSRATHS